MLFLLMPTLLCRIMHLKWLDASLWKAYLLPVGLIVFLGPTETLLKIHQAFDGLFGTIDFIYVLF